MATDNRWSEGRWSRAGETFALIRDAFVQAGRLMGRQGCRERQLSMHITDGSLQLVLSQRDQVKCSSGAASAIASALVHTHSVCKTASVVSDVEAGTATIVRATSTWRTTQIVRRAQHIEQPPGSIILELEPAASAAETLQRELQCFCRRLLFPVFTTTLKTPAGTIREGGRSDLTEKERMREAMELQCESHALLCVQLDDFNCDAFIGVGWLDDNSQTSSTSPLDFGALPVEGYVYIDSVPVNMTPCIGIQELQSLCTKAIEDDARAETRTTFAQNGGPDVREGRGAWDGGKAADKGTKADAGGPMIVLVHIVSRSTGDSEHQSMPADSMPASSSDQAVAHNTSASAAKGVDSKCPLCSQDFSQWSEVSRNANTKLHFRYSHALDWNPKTGALRTLILPSDKTSEGDSEEATGRDGSKATGTSLYQALKPAKGEKMTATNLRLNVKVGPNVGWYRTTVVSGKKHKFPDALPELYQDALGKLKKNQAWKRLRDWVIPSVAKSISLCVDLFGGEAQEKQRVLLESVNATSSSEVLAIVSRNLQHLVEASDRDLPAKRSRADDPSARADDAAEEDSSTVFVTDPGLVGFLRCKDHSNHRKLSDFVERSIVRFLEEYLASVARGGLPSIQIFSSLEDDADLDVQVPHREEDDGVSCAALCPIPPKLDAKCSQGRRRTSLSLSAFDLEQSLEYARLLKVVQLVLTLLRTTKISTMRDVYYMDCRLFENQTKSDRSIELLARCCNVPRYGLNIVSFSRGILCGAILLKEKHGQWMDCASAPVTMPACMHTMQINADVTSAVFVLEKECIFRRLINDNFVERQYNGKALLITACGFPDVQTRMLLNRLSREYPALPIYGIADLDPYGVEIMATYTMGSKSREHERDVLACPTMRWLGIHFSDIEAYQVPTSLKIDMTERDKSRVRKMLEREIFATPSRAFWRQQLQAFLDEGCKYEIEVLNAVHHVGSDPLGFLSGTFIHDKICRGDYWQDDLSLVQDD